MQSLSSRIVRHQFSSCKKIIRTLSSDNGKNVENNKGKTFDNIPGPRRLPLFGNLHLFSRFGPYSFDKLYEAYEDLYKTYGPVVRLELGISMIVLFDPKDIQSILDLKDLYPERPIIEALRHYRLQNKDIYGSAGLVAENGKKWKRLRDATNFMMVPKFAELYLPAQEVIAEDFASRIVRVRDSNGRIKDFLPELYRFTEESIGLVCFGLRLGLMDETKSDTTWSSKITQASDDTLQAFADTFLGFPWWKIYKTKPYKNLVESQNFFHNFASECMAKAEVKLKDPSNSNDVTLQFYKTLSENTGINSKDIGLLMTELFSTGIDATGNMIGFTLYNLAKNPAAQEALYKEIQIYGPSDQRLTNEAIDKMKFLRACIKESYRLTPTSGGTARILKTPTQISGYSVPANVLCVGINPIICRQSKYFPDPLEFKPERWLTSREDNPDFKPHPFCILPFSHGVRRCVGQRFAEQEIKLCIIKLIQKYRIRYEGPEIGTKMRLLLLPDKPLNFFFEERHA